jgi:hypothetical protein
MGGLVSFAMVEEDRVVAVALSSTWVEQIVRTRRRHMPKGQDLFDGAMCCIVRWWRR